ncbi:hypothetical protein [Bacteroides sp.]
MNIWDKKRSAVMAKIKSQDTIHTYNYQTINEPIIKIHNYVNSNFKKNITSNEIANYIQMTPASLYRYFKHKTNKTIFESSNEIGAEHACKF